MEWLINKLGHLFRSNQAFDDKIKLGSVAADFKSINMNGKYVKMEFHIEDGGQFLVDVDLQHDKFDHPKFDVQVHKELNNKSEIKGYVDGEKKNYDSSLTIRGFDNSIY